MWIQPLPHFPRHGCGHQPLPCPAAGYELPVLRLSRVSDLMLVTGSSLQQPKSRNPNLDNGIPDIRIPAHRTRSAFGFGIPPYDLLIPREIQKTDGYDRVATK